MSPLPRALASRAALVFALLSAFGSVFVSAPARAAGAGPAKWTEWHVAGDDVSITVDRAGMARIEHTIRYRVVMGPMRGLELVGIEKSARLGADATITSEDGRELAATVEPKGEAGLHVTVADAKGLKRGTYTFRLHYDVDLVAARELARDGAMWRLAWRSPVAVEGYDAAHVVVSVPAAPTEPRRVKTGPVAEPESSGIDEGGEDGVIATLHRTPERDELELVRPHVSRGEAPLWAARLDPKAFPDVRAPEMRPAPPPAPAAPSRLREASRAAGLAAIALLFGALVRAKMRAFAAACARAKVSPAPLVRVSPSVAGAAAGLAAAGGIALQALAWPTMGAALIAVAMLMGVSRTPSMKRAPRGPGRWGALDDDEAFGGDLSRARRVRLADALDPGTRAGKIAVALVALAAVATAVLLRAVAPEAPYLVAIDALALVPLFATGRAAQLPPDPARSPAPLLRAAMRALTKDGALTVVPWARVPIGAERADELRLLIVPRASLPGLAGLELGVAWRRTATAWAPSFEVLVRAYDGSDAAARLAALAPFARPVTGRKPEEKVVVLIPRLPGRAAAVALVQRLARELVDRRTLHEEGGAWRGAERRAGWGRTDEVPAAA